MKFDYGDAVKVIADAPAKFLKFGAFGSVCAIDEIARSERAIEFSVQQGTFVYLVEFPAGEAIEIPEIYLMPG